VNEKQREKRSNNQLDYMIDAWHTGDTEVPLHEYLGVSFEDYGKWVEGKLSAEALLALRKP
jgi:hypothetical protein